MNSTHKKKQKKHWNHMRISLGSFGRNLRIVYSVTPFFFSLCFCLPLLYNIFYKKEHSFEKQPFPQCSSRNARSLIFVSLIVKYCLFPNCKLIFLWFKYWSRSSVLLALETAQGKWSWCVNALYWCGTILCSQIKMPKQSTCLLLLDYIINQCI